MAWRDVHGGTRRLKVRGPMGGPTRGGKHGGREKSGEEPETGRDRTENSKTGSRIGRGRRGGGAGLLVRETATAKPERGVQAERVRNKEYGRMRGCGM